MTELLQPQPGESIYDPTCGSGGMLLSCIAQLRRQGKEWRNVRLYGQERNLMTSSIARMNCFLHGIEDFRIERGDTLSEPKFVQGDRLMQFDVVLANPPYSIKQWDREAFASDPWGRNIFGTPPQGRADYAFWQHIICSLSPKTGRCAILFPHGVLFRQEEAEMRRKLIEADIIECVLGLGPNLFYNSPMEACIVICRTDKPKERRGKILFINAVDEVTRERAQSFLTYEHVEHIVKAYNDFKNKTGFARVAALDEIRAKDNNLSIPLYVTSTSSAGIVVEKEDATYRIGDLSFALDGWLILRKDAADSLHSILPDISFSAADETSNTLETCSIFGRSKWQRVRFGDVVQNVNETERCPAEMGIERFIGLEHIEPGSLHIRSWGNVEEGTTFTRRCRPMQVLFGKRRAYQRKVAVAEFDAVVSGDIYVFAPKNDRLLPEILPFLCMSERFFQHAVGTSAGSLSPRTNWKNLAQFEFGLPPLDQQRRIAEMLWALNEVVEKWRETNQNTENARSSKLKAMMLGIDGGNGQTIHDIGDFIPPRGWALQRAKELVISPITKGATPSSYLNTKYAIIPFLKVYNLTFTGDLDFSIDPTYIEPQVHQRELKRSQVRSGDILMNLVGPPLGKTALLPDGFPEANVNQAIAIYRIEDPVMREFFLEYLRSDLAQTWFERRSKKTSGQQNLTLQLAQDLPVPVPPVEVISKVVKLARSFAVAQRNISTILEAALHLRQSIINGLGVNYDFR
jgi:type I restriction enzyme M protein